MSTATGLAPLRAFRNIMTADPFRAFQQRMNRMFEDSFAPLTIPVEETLFATTWTPSCDVFETETELVLKAELPGAKKEDVKISLEGNILTLRGERKFEEETKKENYLRVERTYGEFLRSFTLPPTVEVNKIKAEFRDGILRIAIPKKEEARPKLIDVKVQ